jgi:hypothetical protein
MYISPTRIWTFDYQNRADPNKIHRFLGIFPDPAGGSVRRIGNALILGLVLKVITDNGPRENLTGSI